MTSPCLGVDMSGKAGRGKKRKSTAVMSQVQKTTHNKLQRLFAPAWPLRGTRMKEVYRTEKEMNTARQIGRTLLNILAGSDLLKQGPEYGRDLSQALRLRNQCKENLIQQRRKQFLEIIRAKTSDADITSGNGTVSTSITATTTSSPAPSLSVRPVIKTYSRKNKQTPYFKPVSNPANQLIHQPKGPSLKFVAPTAHTLAGMRGLFLCMKPLREQVVESCVVSSRGTGTPILETNFNDPVFFGVRREQLSLDDTTSDDGTLSHREADARLRDRFMSLFLWPALMATVKPDERRYVKNIMKLFLQNFT